MFLQVHLQAVFYDGFGVIVSPATGQQRAHEFLTWHVEVNCGLHLSPEGLGHIEGRLRLFDCARETIEYVSVGLRRGDQGLRSMSMTTPSGTKSPLST